MLKLHDFSIMQDIDYYGYFDKICLSSAMLYRLDFILRNAKIPIKEKSLRKVSTNNMANRGRGRPKKTEEERKHILCITVEKDTFDWLLEISRPGEKSQNVRNILRWAQTNYNPTEQQLKAS